MNRELIIEKIKEILKDIFDDDSLVITEKTCANDIEDWDSLTHISIICALEQEFHMNFSVSEVQKLANIGEIADVIAKRIK